jgi:trk system potassium uptake protein TrkH
VVLLLGAGGFLYFEYERSTRGVLKVSALYVAAMQVLLVSRIVVAAVRLNLAMSRSRLHPTRVLTLTFLTLIVLGGLALSLPKATHRHLHDRPDFSVPRHVLNSLFTATSATCVTGLVVYDTGSDFTRFGQVVVLGLIQAGGLGIMIFGSLVGLLVGRQLSLKQSLVLQDALSYRTLGLMRRMIAFIVVTTLVTEAIGAAVLYPMWEGMATPGERVYFSIFHAISAFCNAGFALQSDNLVAYNRAWQVYVCVVPLIILGGLGFPVLHDLWKNAVASLRLFWSRRRGVSLKTPMPSRPRFTLHTKLVLVTTVVLIALPTVGFFVFESFAVGIDPGSTVPATMASDSIPGRVLDGFFYAVTSRTAGFNTVGMGADEMSPTSHFLGAVLMFIGGSPASTAGGIKTVGLAVLVLGIWTTLRGRTSVEAFGRKIPEYVVRRAAVVAILMAALVSLVTLMICFTEHTTLREAWFEAVSACGTVGLSTGLTPELTSVGRVTIMIAMFAGRLGPLTVLIALAGRTHASRYDYPTEQVGIG